MAPYKLGKCVISSALYHCSKDLIDTDKHDGVITHLEPDILACEVKWALESTNKASGGDGMPVELFQILNAFLIYPEFLKCGYTVFLINNKCIHFKRWKRNEACPQHTLFLGINSGLKCGIKICLY